MMKTNIINWFRISNWLDLTFRYRLVEVAVEGLQNNSKELNKAFFNAIKFLSSETKGVVSSTHHNGKRYIAIKEDAVLEKRTIAGSPLNIVLTPLEGVHVLNPRDMEDDKLELAIRFLESAIDFQLNKNNQLWDAGTNVFLNKIPLDQSNDRKIDTYQGFKYKVVAEDKNNVFVCIDLAYKYVGKQTLQEMLKGLPQERHAALIQGKNFLYQNGDSWYTVKGSSAGLSISITQVDNDVFNGSVYDYITTKGRYATSKNKPSLDRNSPTFWHGYGNSTSNVVAGASSLAKPIHFAENGLHKVSINDPDKRFRNAEFRAAKYFQNLSFGNVALKIATKPHQKSCDAFSLPSLKYGNNVILDPYAGEIKYNSPLRQFPKRRREFIYKNGILSDAAFTPQYIFVPDNLPYSFAKSLKYYMDSTIKQIAKGFTGFVIHQYSMKQAPFSSKVCEDIKAMVASKNLAGGIALFILPEGYEDGGRFNTYLHHLVKKELFSQVKMKCVSAKRLLEYMKPVVNAINQKIYEVPDSLASEFRSYQMNTIFELLIINKKWPYALAENLHHDLYIGIDAHDFFAGFVFFFKNGEKIVFDVQEVSKSTGSFRNEKINHAIIQEKIVKVLGRHLKIGEDVPKSIVILRDGVSFGEEEKALVGAIDELHKQGLINKDDVKLAVVDVAKSSAIPVRAAAYNGSTKILENPSSGTHFYMNNKNAFIFNTGFPYKVRGSSMPLQVSLAFGEIEFDKVLEDVFRLTQITFSSPDRPTSLPLPLKLIDTLIRDVAHEYNFANTQEKEVKMLNAS